MRRCWRSLSSASHQRAAIRRRDRIDSGRDRHANAVQPDHEGREGRQAGDARSPRPSRGDQTAPPSADAPAEPAARGTPRRRRRPPPQPRRQSRAAAQAADNARRHPNRARSRRRGPRRRRLPPSRRAASKPRAAARAAEASTRARDAAERGSSPTRSEAEPLAKAVEAARRQPPKAYDPKAIAKLIGQSQVAAPRRPPRRRRRACRTSTRRTCRLRWPPRSTLGSRTPISSCWTPAADQAGRRNLRARRACVLQCRRVARRPGRCC